MNKTEETGGRERSIAATWRRKNRSEKLYFPLPRVTSARLKVNSCKYSSSSSSLIIIYSILLLLFENFKTIQEISNKRKRRKNKIAIKIRIRENGNSIGEERLRLRKRRAGIGFAEAMLDAKWKITGQRGSLALEHIRRRVWAFTRSREHVRTNSFGCFGKRPTRVSLMCLPEFVPAPPHSPSHSLSLFHTLLLLSPVRLLFCFTDSVSFRPRDTPFHRPRYSSRYSTRLGTYVWLREMLSCISSRMFDGALLFKHGARH